MGKLIVIEGIDGSGKSTQFELLRKRLGDGAAYASFPDYDTPSGMVIKQYLGGEFGDNADAVNPYAASAVFAVNRIASFLKDDWGRAYRAGGAVVAARYTTSNALHQASKLPRGERKSYFEWLEATEYGLYGLPKPDLVIYLRIGVETARRHIISRGEPEDIHERDMEYLSRCVCAAEDAAEYYGWSVIDAERDGEMLPPGEISDRICSMAIKTIKDGDNV